MDPEVGGYLLDRHARAAIPRDPYDILAELFRIRLGHSDILPTRPTGQASSDVTRSRNRPFLMMYRQQTKNLLGPGCTVPRLSAFASADGG
ncbi:hypothetical protein [Streptomyces sp. E1N211]|uniref:hypothetical protein n=1 Tax=Streptomyces sp. E1N211 TaxID=1851876 RepID=UPI0012D92245|nr:hypothetical protein [Streptomyces sp. E1N211]